MKILMILCVFGIIWAEDISQSLQQECDGGNTIACFNLGLMYHNGKGIRQDYRQAKEFFGKACDLGDQGGCDAYRGLNEAGY